MVPYGIDGMPLFDHVVHCVGILPRNSHVGEVQVFTVFIKGCLVQMHRLASGFVEFLDGSVGDRYVRNAFLLLPAGRRL